MLAKAVNMTTARPGRDLQQFVQDDEAVLGAEFHVEEAHVEPFGFNELEGAGSVGRLHGLMAGGLHGDGGGFADAGFVVDDEDSHGATDTVR